MRRAPRSLMPALAAAAPCVMRSTLCVVLEHLVVGDPFCRASRERSTSRRRPRALLPGPCGLRVSTGQDSCRQPAKIIVAGHSTPLERRSKPNEAANAALEKSLAKVNHVIDIQGKVYTFLKAYAGESADQLDLPPWNKWSST
jgi:hypothetical protein